MVLQSIVVGTGWAGEGHTRALQAAGVEVVALCGRSPGWTRALADELGVPAHPDWCAALNELRPDVVAIATPGGAHRDVAVAAAEAGCHVACEKPLAVTVADARAMLAAVERAGVKHAYAASGAYEDTFRHARRLLTDGLIGQVRLIQLQLGAWNHLLPNMAYNWGHQLKEGGGALNGIFTHLLQQVLFLTSGTVTAVMRTTYRSLERAPVGPLPHHAHRAPAPLLTPEQMQAAEWRPVDADQGFTVLLQLGMPDGHTATAVITLPEGHREPHPSFCAIHGGQGSLYLTSEPGGYVTNHRLEHFDPTRGAWVDVDFPRSVVPPGEDGSTWYPFFRDFVADVRGEGYAGYPTFRDGVVAVEVMEIIRSGRSWTPVPKHLVGGE
ncbi:MAG: Gfo/Idh/MocA family oxidoreductase [Chloroflexota bacterium]|nr:Gfo/Idh/MocA family oxidoreductase [Chloroflexota bacterium]